MPVAPLSRTFPAALILLLLSELSCYRSADDRLARTSAQTPQPAPGQVPGKAELAREFRQAFAGYRLQALASQSEVATTDEFLQVHTNITRLSDLELGRVLSDSQFIKALKGLKDQSTGGRPLRLVDPSAFADVKLVAGSSLAVVAVASLGAGTWSKYDEWKQTTMVNAQVANLLDGIREPVAATNAAFAEHTKNTGEFLRELDGRRLYRGEEFSLRELMHIVDLRDKLHTSPSEVEGHRLGWTFDALRDRRLADELHGILNQAEAKGGDIPEALKKHRLFSGGLDAQESRLFDEGRTLLRKQERLAMQGFELIEAQSALEAKELAIGNHKREALSNIKMHSSAMKYFLASTVLLSISAAIISTELALAPSTGASPSHADNRYTRLITSLAKVEAQLNKF